METYISSTDEPCRPKKISAIKYTGKNKATIIEAITRSIPSCQVYVVEETDVVGNHKEKINLVDPVSNMEITCGLCVDDYVVHYGRMMCTMSELNINRLYAKETNINKEFGGKCLGTSFTSKHLDAISDKSFTGLQIGDYWEIEGIKWRIGEFGRCVNDIETLITIVPDETLYRHSMNKNNKTENGFKYSDMDRYGLLEARELFSQSFSVSKFITTLMNERMVFGKRERGDDNLNNHTFDNEKQLSLFELRPEYIRSSNEDWYWLVDIISTTYFAGVSGGGRASYNCAGSVSGVRPAFSIYM